MWQGGQQPEQGQYPPQQPYTAQPQGYTPQQQPYTLPEQQVGAQGYPPAQYPTGQAYPEAQYPGQGGQPYQEGQYPGQTGPAYPEAQYPAQPYPQTQGYPPGQIPPGNIPPGYMPPYGPGGPGNGGRGGMIALIIGAVVLALVVVGVGGYFLLRPSSSAHSVADDTTSETTEPETTPETTTETTTEEPTTTEAPAPPPAPVNHWIAATFNSGNGNIYWAWSTIGSADASARAQSDCGGSCPTPAWQENGCLGFALGQGGGWGSLGAATNSAAESAAITEAQNHHVAGPYRTWSKCSNDR